jgi:enoyl-CoA hydratase/carnithine racemase
MPDSMTDPVVLKLEPPLAWITVNRPAAHNALNSEVWKGLAETVQRVADDKSIRVVILHGAGDKAFISGADISEFSTLRQNAAMTAKYDQLSIAAWSAIHSAPQPVIAMINGLCYGGGVAVALACDIRFASDHGRFAVPAIRLGLSYPMAGGVEKLVQTVGPTHAAHILLSGQPFDAQEAARIGLINRVVARGELENETREYAMRMAEGAPLTIAAHKMAIRESLRAESDRNEKDLLEAMRRCFDSEDYQEGIAAFLAKRAPRFRGC